jgi:hypothetical protein
MEALRRILETTEALASTLEPLDLDAFEQALASRSEALRGLEAAAARAHGTPPPWADPRAAALGELSSAVTRSDARAREKAQAALNGLREELKGVAVGRAGLDGYRPATLNAPRFADRKG